MTSDNDYYFIVPQFSHLRLSGILLFLVDVALFLALLVVARQRRVDRASEQQANDCPKYNLRSIVEVDTMLEVSSKQWSTMEKRQYECDVATTSLVDD